MKSFLKFLLALCLVSCSGCAGCRNDISSRGGLVGSYKGTYIVLNQSGGETLDKYSGTTTRTSSTSLGKVAQFVANRLKHI